MTPNVIYMMNLCISDLVFIMMLPIKILETIETQWILPAVFCPVYNLLHFSTLYASTTFLTAISAGRYLSVAFPIKYQLRKKPKYSCWICAILWLLVVVHVTLVFLLENIVITSNNSTGITYFISTMGNSSVCYDNFTEQQLDLLAPVRLEISIVLFFLPLILTAFCYLRCIRILIRTKLSERKKKRAIALAMSTLATFVMCFAPYNISHVVGFVLHQNLWWRKLALLCTTCNAFLDPFIFFFLSSTMERTFHQCWQLLRRKWEAFKQKLIH
ncbi:free fatty acid receptor 2-like [Latimeria chalumnae]|uniref:free fatty acid receptor 2-like n=1 Tax=Latimeria chalumnae TaxID=7897 RepID=UPI0006D93858|nr:PREDICTED: free fatty acid receptor 2-like [Latimeria chalumnae]|eukprot:XP_006011340.2 PREDICTED: free fatty acid receptor 2-like [Latimeria chalumnae]